MANTFNLQVVVQDRTIFEGAATSVIVPGEAGYLGVLANHAPLLSTLGEGRLDIKTDGDSPSFNISGGFVEVLNNEVTVLADRVVQPDRIEDTYSQED